MYGEVAKLYGKNDSSIGEIVKNEKEFRANFAVLSEAANVSHHVGLASSHIATGRVSTVQHDILRERERETIFI